MLPMLLLFIITRIYSFCVTAGYYGDVPLVWRVHALFLVNITTAIRSLSGDHSRLRRVLQMKNLWGLLVLNGKQNLTTFRIPI